MSIRNEQEKQQEQLQHKATASPQELRTDSGSGPAKPQDKAPNPETSARDSEDREAPFLQSSLVKENSRNPVHGIKAFLRKQNIVFSFQRYGIDALGAMALGLFASLLIGTIVNTAGTLIGAGNPLGALLLTAGSYAMKATGPAMAAAIGFSLKAPPLVLFTLAGVGLAANELGGAGGPLAVFVIAVIACELGKLVSKTTPVDIIVTPLVTIVVGVGLSMWWAPAIGQAAASVGNAIIWATQMQPLIMGILVSVIMGVTLTLPISSAAIAASFGLVGLAGGAAVAGCCAQMVGFAVMSYRDNGLGGLVAQGLGTSMLQIPNIMRKPLIWLPPTLASAITGPLATAVFKLEMNGAPISSGMGTSGLVGQIGVITGWFNPSEKALAHGAAAAGADPFKWAALLLISFVLPALLTWLIAVAFRKAGWIKDGDMKLNLG